MNVPEKVDIIISEPMGFVLVHERMLESYVAARDRFLKPGGIMMPTTGTIYVAPFSDDALYQETLAKVRPRSGSLLLRLDVASLKCCVRLVFVLCSSCVRLVLTCLLTTPLPGYNAEPILEDW